jgi:hypothetical protein
MNCKQTNSRNTNEYICHSTLTRVWNQKEERNTAGKKVKNGMEKLFTKTYDFSFLQKFKGVLEIPCSQVPCFQKLYTAM